MLSKKKKKKNREKSVLRIEYDSRRRISDRSAHNRDDSLLYTISSRGEHYQGSKQR